MDTTNQVTLDVRLRAIVQGVTDGLYELEDATLLLRGEVLAGYFRGREGKTKASLKERFGHREMRR